MDGSTKLRNPALAGWARTADGAGPCGSGHSVGLRKAEYFWKNPIADARFRTITDFDVVSEAAAISPDGNLVAFLSDRDGPMDVWMTQVGSGEYHLHSTPLLRVTRSMLQRTAGCPMRS